MTKFVDVGINRRYLVEDALNTEVFGIAQSLYHSIKPSIIVSLLQITDTRKIQQDTSGCVSSFPYFFVRSNHRGSKTFLTFPSFL